MGGLLCNFIFSSTLTLIVDQVYPLFRAGLGFHFAWEKISKPILVCGLGFVLVTSVFWTLGACGLVSVKIRPTLEMCVRAQSCERRQQAGGSNRPKLGCSPCVFSHWLMLGFWIVGLVLLCVFSLRRRFVLRSVFLHSSSQPSIHGSLILFISLP